MKNQKDLVLTIYTKVLTVNHEHNPSEVLKEILAESFKSVNTKEAKDKATMIAQMGYLWKVIPNLKWEPQEVLEDGNKVIVRSIFSGSPKGEFMGITFDGTKSFKAMSIDIHTVENNKITNIYHIEEWNTAMEQLKK